ncbi:RNA polymerase sigma factor [Mesonia sp. K7]|uniref:RNA polymerase sigma factor n=1 Tax=Mesonia sp. K7 TaxID=2218606 RepID=UPI000DA9A20A|nr:RNA polymerase sigma factor [Mesonia sp. K7]PZD78231.1 RNA polymerase subunit sigma-70 [Mesonia sp. K7]
MSKLKEKVSTLLSDEDLVDRIVQTKDTCLFAEIYDRYAQKIYHKCLSFVKSTEEAQDLTHDIFVKLFLKLKSFKHQSKFSTWLYSFTYNFCLNYVNRELAKQKNIFVNSYELDENRLEEIISDDEIYKLKTEKLELALKKVDPETKSILLMKYQDDFSLKEIMDVFDIGESATKMRLNRAKQKLIEVYKTI